MSSPSSAVTAQGPAANQLSGGEDKNLCIAWVCIFIILLLFLPSLSYKTVFVSQVLLSVLSPPHPAERVEQ